MYVCAGVCVLERERERESDGDIWVVTVHLNLCAVILSLSPLLRKETKNTAHNKTLFSSGYFKLCIAILEIQLDIALG